MTDYETALKVLQRGNELETRILQAAIQSGAKERGLNPKSAMASLEKKLEQLREMQQAVEEMGTTLPNVIKSYRMSHKGSDLVPSEMKFAPIQWVSEDSVEKQEVLRNGRIRNTYSKVRGVTAAQASRLRRGIQSQLEELFLILEESDKNEEEKDAYRQAVIDQYHTKSYKDFTENLLNALNDSVREEYLVEDEVLEEDEDLEAELEQCLELVS